MTRIERLAYMLLLFVMTTIWWWATPDLWNQGDRGAFWLLVGGWCAIIFGWIITFIWPGRAADF